MTAPTPTAIPIRPDGLQLDENRPFQNRFWVVQRLLWGLFVLVVLVAATGLTGRGGPLAQGHATLGAAQVTWPRITRRGAPETLTFQLPQTPAATEITVGDRLQALFQIETIVPRPAMEAGGAPLRLAFFPDGTAPQTIRLSIRSQRAGIARYAVGIGAETLTLTTVVLP